MAKKAKKKKARIKIRRFKKTVRKLKKRPIKPKKIVLRPVAVKPASGKVSEEIVHRTKVRVVGVGGGGGSIVSEIASKIKKADFVVANTDARALRGAGRNVKKFSFGQSVTKGLGTGMNPVAGETAAHNEKDKIKKLFEGQDLCIIIASLGGGTSSGATPVFAKMARDAGVLTYGIFTLPFDFEGERKKQLANDSLQRIKPYLNAYSVIPNERIFQIIEKNSPLQGALSAINKRLADNLEGLLEMIYLPGLINIDFADLRTILDGRGRLAYLNTIEIESPTKEEATRKIVSSPLYPYNIKGARGILYDITGGKDLQLAEVSYISRIIADSINKEAKIIFGISQKGNYSNKIKITLLATGCATKSAPTIPTAPGPSAGSPDQEKPVATPAVSRPKKAIPSKPVKKSFLPKKKMRKIKPDSQPEKSKIIDKISKIALVPFIENNGAKAVEVKVRRNALELRKAVEEEEKQIIDQEKVWDPPAIFRKKEISNN